MKMITYIKIKNSISGPFLPLAGKGGLHSDVSVGIARRKGLRTSHRPYSRNLLDGVFTRLSLGGWTKVWVRPLPSTKADTFPCQGKEQKTETSPSPSQGGGLFIGQDSNLEMQNSIGLQRTYLMPAKQVLRKSILFPLLRRGLGRGLAIFAILLTTSCTQDFEEINTNPNSPVSVQPSLLLRQVLYDYGEQMSYEGFTAGNLLGQYTTALDFNLFDRHDLKSPQLGGNPWPIFYKNLGDNEIILNLALENETFAVYEGPSRIMKAYMAAALTDIFGDVPYSEAFRGQESTVTPKYDAQEAIYTGENGVLDNLDKGIAAIEAYSGAIALEGDILFNGDLNGWLRFANSLKIKYLIRTSDKIDVSQELAALVAEGNYISENSQNAVFDFTAGEPNNFRLARLRIGDFNNFVLSETMDEVLTGLNDPRIATLFLSFANSTDDGFNGLLNGIDASQTSIAIADYSLAGTIFRENTAVLDANFMTSWETHFLLAEAAEKGLISGAANEFYDTGVTQAFAYWNTPLPVSYLTAEGSYTASGTSPLQQIITQKWIGNMINGYEGWIEYRRTGFPILKTISASLNNDLIPVRMPYPAEEEALNNVNYTEAAAATDGNSINVSVWWDEAP